jgi:SAM-dependent methyltransferase
MTDWQQRYLDQDTPWDKGAPHPALDEALERFPMLGSVAVPGCGYGYDLAEIALRCPSVGELIGFDLAPAAVTQATAHLAQESRAKVMVADIFSLGSEWRGQFDWVWEHTCFCAIDPADRPQYVRSMAELLKPSGRLLGVFYLHPWDTEAENRTCGPPFGVTAAELDNYFAPCFTLSTSWIPKRTYPGREGKEEIRLWIRNC